jgi:hypothetical protein
MLNKITASLAGAAVLVLGVAQPALAQHTAPVTERTESDRASGTLRGERVLPGRIGGDRRSREGRQQEEAQRQRATRTQAQAQAQTQTPEQISAAAQAQLTAAGVTCQLTEAVNPGTISDAQVYEAACANASGYILIATTPTQAFSCIELAGTAAIARARDPNADVGQQCVLPANQNGLAVISGWAREAGVTCNINEAQAIGKSDAENMVYEVGCAGADGYWLEKAATGWDLKDCLQVISTGGSCRFTTAQEQADGLEAKLAGTPAAACDVTQARMMGSNANGKFYEVKCAAEGEGYIARINNQGVTQQTYPCATAQRIGGGCTLTAVAAAAPTGGRL